MWTVSPPPQFLSEPSKARALEGWGVLETSNLYLCLFFLHHQSIHLPQYILKFTFYVYIEGCLKPPICIFVSLSFINQFICLNAFSYLLFKFTLRGVWSPQFVSLFVFIAWASLAPSPVSWSVSWSVIHCPFRFPLCQCLWTVTECSWTTGCHI